MSDPKQRKKLNAEEYLSQNRARWLTEHITMELVRFKPVNPLSFIAKRISEIGAAQSERMRKGAGKVTSPEVEYSRPRLLCVIGGPSSGKDLVCSYLNDHGMVALNINDLILAEIKGDTEVGRTITETINDGREIPSTILAHLIKGRIEDHHITYVLNGYPRTMEQAITLEKEVSEVTSVILTNCPESVQKERMTSAQVPVAQQDKAIIKYLYDTYPVVAYYNALRKVTSLDTSLPKEKVLEIVKRIAWD